MAKDQLSDTIFSFPTPLFHQIFLLFAYTVEAGAEAAGEGCLESGTADHTSPKFDTDMLVSPLRQENARNICVIKVPPEMKYSDYFVIGSVISTRYLHALAYFTVKIHGDSFDAPETRETYQLEKLWTLYFYATPETLPEDFILGIDDTSSLTPVEFEYE
ncbi:hypothetical protein HPG69_013175 [Diceros bicornis minor]|uniref:Uncharacterized protein n=1 Tax=Diceros bicornis minor TaxID=77932 RepID=A0A7J7F476_DICBM|nr:hypothetical protein HPG69_013175 [Diceros bicornis minor]